MLLYTCESKQQTCYCTRFRKETHWQLCNTEIQVVIKRFVSDGGSCQSQLGNESLESASRKRGVYEKRLRHETPALRCHNAQNVNLRHRAQPRLCTCEWTPTQGGQATATTWPTAPCQSPNLWAPKPKHKSNKNRTPKGLSS
jgi:hypothetical protein